MAVTFWASLALLLPACLHAAWSDLFRRLIPNMLCLATALTGLACAGVTGGVDTLADHCAHFLLALAGGMLLFRLGMIGGGDAKFYAGCAAWFGLPQAVSLLVTVTLAGFLLFLGWFVIRRIQRRPIRAASDRLFDRLPYGLAIAGGTLLLAFQVV
jgi:prepilin peptidase CpaA